MLQFPMIDINRLISDTLNKYSKSYYTFIHEHMTLLCNDDHSHEDNFHTLVAEITGLLMMHNIEYEIHDNYNISLALN